MTRLVLADDVRAPDVDTHFARLGFAVSELVPRVFPGRAEAARTVWVTDDERTRAVLWVEVDPPRRIVAIQGEHADEIAHTVRLRLGALDREALVARLFGKSDARAFAAAYQLADGYLDEAIAPLDDCLRGKPSDYVASGCVRALERVGPAALDVLDSIRLDDAHSPAVRVLASAAASSLRYP